MVGIGNQHVCLGIGALAQFFETFHQGFRLWLATGYRLETQYFRESDCGWLRAAAYQFEAHISGSVVDSWS